MTRLERLTQTGKTPDRFEGKDAGFYELVDHGYQRGVDIAETLTFHHARTIEVDASAEAADVLKYTVFELSEHHDKLPRGASL